MPLDKAGTLHISECAGASCAVPRLVPLGVDLARLVFVSDVHLSPWPGPELATFTDLVTSLRRLQDAGQPQALFVLGDLFSFWVDRPCMTRLFRPVLEALAALARAGCPVTMLDGNRDFAFGRVLRRSTGARPVGERLLLEHRGHRVLLMHGDQLLTKDRRYRFFRHLIRCLPARLVARLIPSSLLLHIVRRLEQVSSAEKSRKLQVTMAVDLDAAGRAAAADDADVLIHGHTHRPGRAEVQVEGKRITVLCLGNWGPGGAAILEWPEDGEPGLLHWPPPPQP